MKPLRSPHVTTRSTLRALLAFTFVFLLALTATARDLPCPVCGKLVKSGQFVEIDGKQYHAPCFTCAYCHKPIGANPYFVKNNKFYDPACYRKLFGKKCAHCNKPIDGDYRTFDGHEYHETCFMSHIAPRCKYCSAPIDGEYFIYDGLTYHDSCYTNHVAERCRVCGQLIKGEYVQDYWGNRYHKSHATDMPVCDICGRPICDTLTHGGTVYPDGRHVCSLCYQSAIIDVEAGDSLVEIVRQKLCDAGIGLQKSKFSVRLVSRPALAAMMGHMFAGHNGFTEMRKKTFFGGLITDKNITVSILYGLPHDMFVSVAAHELMHVWVFSHGKTDMASPLHEGSCNYAAYLVLRDLHTAESAWLLATFESDPHPDYGVGYRKVRRFVESAGIPTWLEYLRHNTAPPW